MADPVTPAPSEEVVSVPQPTSEPVETPIVEEVPKEAPAVQEDEQAVLKKRLSGAISEVEKKNEELRKAVDLQASFVQETPEFIHKVAETDPAMANKIAQKLWGHVGIRSYKQLMERAKMEQLKEEDPNLYETSVKVEEIQAKLQDREERESKSLVNKFLKDKNILENEYDPKYKKLQEALELVNPSIIKEDLGKALELAHSLAFSSPMSVENAAAPTLNVGGGVPPSPLPPSKPQDSEQSAWLIDGLNKLRGYNIPLNS